jgi:MFS family permease
VEPRSSSFIGDLRTVLGRAAFRKLYATRLISQTGDGIFTAGLGTYVFFNASVFPDPGKAAVAFAVLYLPYSFVGPFAGVFIDRWDRRQILVWSAVIRAAFVVLAAAFIAAGALGLPIWLAALIALGVNRFFLSALSAALPHVVEGDELVMANSVGPTSGTVVAFIGGIVGTAVHVLTGDNSFGSAATILVAGLCYLAAGLSALRMPKASLGPAPGAGAPQGAIGSELENVVEGLWAGLRHVGRRRGAAGALLATGIHRFLYGIVLLMSVLLYRNYFYHASSKAALDHFLPVVISSAVGYGLAAWLTPVATRRMTSPTWITLLLVAGGVLTGAIGVGFLQVEFVVIGFILGIVAQGIAISTTTILQRDVDDDFRGRVFAVNDMVYNTAFALGAAISVPFMPISGHSVTMLLVVAVGYVIGAGCYRLLTGPMGATGQPAPDGGSVTTPDSPAQRSSS